MSNKRPVGLLFAEAFGLAFGFVVLWKGLTNRSVIRKEITRLYGEGQMAMGDRPDYDATVPLFVTQGNSAITDLAGGALLIGIFDAYSPGRGGWSDGSSYDRGSGCSGGSSCGGSSCGSSCGGCSGS
jgi:hypothetical protein